MRSVLVTIGVLSCLSFVVVFNTIGELWDMGGYNVDKDRPVDKAYAAPTIYSGSAPNASYFETKDLVLSTAVFGGNVSMQWYYNDKKLDGADTNILFVFHARESNTGVYTLKASNEFGSTEYSIDVKILPREDMIVKRDDPPNIIYHTGGGRAIIGRPFSIAVTATGNKNEYRWYKNGMEIVNAASHRLLFTAFSRKDTATYEVKVENKHGKQFQKFYIEAERELDYVGGS